MIKKKGITLLLFLSCFIIQTNGQDIAIKSNLAADLTTTINLGTEIGLTPKTTLDLYANYNPWSLGDQKQFKHFLFQPEYRYWFCERFSGHFVGIHAHAGVFNVGGINMPFGLWNKLEDNRYEGEFIGAGVSYGYQWVLGKHWNIEGNIGIGYAYINYDRYKCKSCGKLLDKDKKYHYFGPTKAAISLIYLF